MPTARLIRRNRRKLVIACLPFVAALAGCMGFVWLVSLAALLPALAAFVLTAFSFVWGAGRIARTLHENPAPSVHEISCDADASTVRIGDRVIDRAKIRNASIAMHGDEAQVELIVTPSLASHIRLRLDSYEDAEALVESLRLGVRHQAASFVLGAPMLAKHSLLFFLALVGAGLGLMLAFPGNIVPFMVLMMLVPIVSATLPQRVTVGLDGLHLWSGYRRHFIPYPAISTMSEKRALGERCFVIELFDGRTFSFPVTQGKETLARLRERIEAARSQYEQSDVTDAASALARGNDAPGAWFDRLRALTEVGQHRTAAVVRDSLWRVLESPSSPLTARAAAYVALKPNANEADRLRIQEVANATASRRLRIALQTEEEEAMIEALAALEGETARLAR